MSNREWEMKAYPTATQASSARVLNGFRAAMALYLVAVPYIFQYRWDATSINNVICGLLALVPVAASRRFPRWRFAHIPLALWLGSSAFIFHSRVGAFYSDIFVAKIFILAAIGSPEIFEP